MLNVSNKLLFLVTAYCSKSILEGAWITSLGYTFKQQHVPWSGIQTGEAADGAVGSKIYFYCFDPLKRPRRDDWDDDRHDGVITGYCSHGGEYDLPMNPADWDRCRIRCPVEKPQPPAVGQQSLIYYDKEEKRLRELWEDEEVTYSCKNKSRVINKVKGVLTINYVCQVDGEYSAPTGKGSDKWPICTPEPTDPRKPLLVQLPKTIVSFISFV